MTRPASPRRRSAPWIVGLAAFGFLAATEPGLAIVWDEGFTLGRVDRVRNWVRGMVHPAGFAAGWAPPPFELVQQDGPPPPGRPKVVPPPRHLVDSRVELLSPPVLQFFWPFAREEPHGHPPFYALVGLIGDALTPWRAPLGRARLGTMLAFSLVTAWTFAFLDRRRGRWAAATGAAALVLQPRLFGHAHYATYDALLTALWVAALLAFSTAVGPSPAAAGPESPRPPGPRWAWVAAFGAILGCACATKLTGWLIPIPLACWVALYRDRAGALALVGGGLVALIVAYGLIPPWWADPVDGFRRFLASNLGRAESIPITTMFLGRIYLTPAESLPWYNTLVITLFITPVGWLFLAITGVAGAIRRLWTDRFGVLVAGNWAFLLLLRSLPHVPGHDAERLFLPAFGCLALAAGLGGGVLVDRLGRWVKLLVGGAIVEGVVSVALFLPVPLAYYSPVVGGPAGAARLGMEPTYYWDSLVPANLDWLNRNTPPGGKVAWVTQPTSLFYLRQTGQLRPGLHPHEPGRYVWYVLQNRSGSLGETGELLIELGHPALTYRKFGVPLLWVFPFAEYDQVSRAIAEKRGAP